MYFKTLYNNSIKNCFNRQQAKIILKYIRIYIFLNFQLKTYTYTIDKYNLKLFIVHY